MSTALDLYLLRAGQVKNLVRTRDVEGLDGLRPVYNLTNLEVDELAAGFGCESVLGDPLIVDYETGLLVTRWHPDLVRRLAALEEACIPALLEDPEGVFQEALKELAAVCRECVQQRLALVQVDSML
ncbi:MAG: hypothetical protein AB1758_03455 [Candidatus Eremiobacterota bacterium]